MSIYAEKSRWCADKANNLEMNFQHPTWKCPFHIPLTALGAVMHLVPQSCLTLASPWTVARQIPLSMGILQAWILEWVAMPFSRGSSQPRDQTQVSCITGKFFTSWATREPQFWGFPKIGLYSPWDTHGLYSPWDSPASSTGVGSLSLLQWIFPTQESNRGLLHCKWILYQLGYQGSPLRGLSGIKKTLISADLEAHPSPSLPPIHPSGHQSSLYSVVVQGISVQLSEVTLWPPWNCTFWITPW